VAAKPSTKTMMPDADWAAFKEAVGCCPIGTGVPLDYTLCTAFGDKKVRGLAVESSANDGATQSNTLIFAEHRGWGALLVEPFPSKFGVPKKRRCDDSTEEHARTVCVQAGLVDDPVAKPTLRLSDTNLVAKEVGSGGTEVSTARLGDLLDANVKSPRRQGRRRLVVAGHRMGRTTGSQGRGLEPSAADFHPGGDESLRADRRIPRLCRTRRGPEGSGHRRRRVE